MDAKSDVQSQIFSDWSSLDWVGMTQVQSGIKWGQLSLPVLVDIGVSLVAGYRGIHMSRLYQIIQTDLLDSEVNSRQLNQVVQQCLDSQKDLVQQAAIKISFSLPVKTQSLRSRMQGFRQYPVTVLCEKETSGKLQFWIQFEVIYSSTCPQSASLSVEVFNQQKISFYEKKDTEFNLERLPATPHAQRSRALVSLMVKDFNLHSVQSWIAAVEDALGTPVQTTVKKADEMEFAKLNAENLMFCEDAARKISNKIKNEDVVVGFKVFCEHFESLHPHNASSLKQVCYVPPTKISLN